MSPAYFSRSFKAAFGETPHQYLMSRRMERAKALLRAGATVTDVCMAVGFSSLGSFSTQFKRLVGESPSAYRARDGHEELDRLPHCYVRMWTRPRLSRIQVGCFREATRSGLLYRRPERSRRRAMKRGSPMEKVQSKDGTTIAFDQLGEGPPLILVAGASCDRAIDASIAEGLARHFTVLNYDRRGRGDSGDTLPFAVEREIEDIDVLLAAAGGTATVVGLSSGAALAAEATAAGLPIDVLVLWEPPFSVDADGVRQAKEYAEKLARAAGSRIDSATPWPISCGTSGFPRR